MVSEVRRRRRKGTHLGGLNERSKRHKRIIQHPLIDVGVQVSNKQVCANVELLAVRRGLVDANRFAKELDLVHDFAGVLGVFLGEELAEAVALVRH